MKIAVNTYSLQPSPTGIGRYTSGLLRELINHPDVEDICGLSAHGLLSRSELCNLLDGMDKTTEAGTTSWRKYMAMLPGAHSAWRLLKDVQAWRASRLLEGYCYWEPSFILMPFAGPSVATIHDLSHIHHPEYHPAYRVKMLNKMLPQTFAKATRLNAVSAFTRQALREEGIQSPIDLVHPGVDDQFFTVSTAERQRCRLQLNLPDQYILSVATLEPRKNLERVIKAFLSLPESMRMATPLVLAGTRGWHSDAIESAISSLQSRGQAIRLGYVDQSLIPALYANATLTLYVSHYEGFGMPIIESMAAGTAVLTSDRTSMPEVAGGHALLANPESTDSIASQLQTLLANQELRRTLAMDGQIHASRYRWQHSAHQLLNSLAQAQQEYTA
ncbi:alpha-1,3-rhamnosyl/mannosyltransferase [Marinobacterium halophilum]|uniref:Alpha-1,3-rhamnosyl/mannosyltransferase n=1 Tax=Marinobacterium halophilum TaxID=267374 RepID=A0A2P8EXC1_9GAMM|nr:glycosyltransferase family 1 protein [Marinobacterium halophilum]PSL14117.1 alpha-1,3-rhamnosyl/mannosyltransferase [Marinobacterium halophilum]